MSAEYTALFPFCGLGAGALGFQSARAIATQMLLSLLASDATGFSLSGEGSVWVRERDAAATVH